MTVRVLVCPNAFKGSLAAVEAARAIAEGLGRADAPLLFLPDLLPLADGGDGFMETLVSATEGAQFETEVRDPLGRPIRARWGRLGGDRSDTAVVEMADASGLRLLRDNERDPLRASTFGTGELMRAALDSGCRRLLVGIGGSATNDGGAGMAQALGARLLDAQGDDLPPGGAALARLARIDRTGFRLPPDVEIRIACDVDNPLCGPEGASAVYGPQKGAPPESVRELDAALAHYAAVLEAELGADVAEVPGAGAAGGLGAGLLAFCKGSLFSGVELAMEATNFESRLRESALVITGEGRLDAQTARGKAVAVVARRAKAAGIPVVALVGATDGEAEEILRREGLTAALSILDGPRRLEDAMESAYALISAASTRLARLLCVGLGEAVLP